MIYNTINLQKILTLKSEVEKLLPMKTEDEKRLKKKFRLEINYNSNHIEGNTLTYGQTQLLLLYDKSMGDASVSDIEEMKAHDVALSMVEQIAQEKERPLTEQFIKELNKLILVKPYWKDALTPEGFPTKKKIEIGAYKTSPNSVLLKNGEIHEYASPEETPAKMDDLMKWYNQSIDEMHPFQLAAEFHYRFVCIHPFDDGNGRVARLLMNYILLRNNYPPVIIKSDDKENYLTALQKADIGEIEAIIEYIEEQLVWSLDMMIKAAKGEDLQEYGDIEKEIALLKREKLNVEQVYKTPKVSFELVTFIKDNLFASISKLLKKFDEFFSEISLSVYLGNVKFEETSIKRNLLTLFSEREEPVNSLKVYGRDFREEEIDELSYKWELLGLKSSSKRVDFYLNFHLKMDESDYKIEISRYYTSGKNYILYSESKSYKSFLMKDEIEKITRLISDELLRYIKEQY